MPTGSPSGSCSSTACPISRCSAGSGSARRSRRCCAPTSSSSIEALDQLKGAIQHCETVRDYVSRDLFAEILENEEAHVDSLEPQFEMIEQMGLQNYIQLQSKPAED